MKGCFALVQVAGIVAGLALFLAMPNVVGLALGGAVFVVLMAIGGLGYRMEKRREGDDGARRRERSSLVACPVCAEKIQRAAKKCRFCGAGGELLGRERSPCPARSPARGEGLPVREGVSVQVAVVPGEPGREAAERLLNAPASRQEPSIGGELRQASLDRPEVLEVSRDAQAQVRERALDAPLDVALPTVAPVDRPHPVCDEREELRAPALLLRLGRPAGVEVGLEARGDPQRDAHVGRLRRARLALTRAWILKAAQNRRKRLNAFGGRDLEMGLEALKALKAA